MKTKHHCFITLSLYLFAIPLHAEKDKTATSVPFPPIFAPVVVRPANAEALSRYFSVNQDGDGEGEELPPTIGYHKKGKGPKVYATFMTVTDISLCKRPSEQAICHSFVNTIVGAPPELGTYVSDTRIGGAGYTTVFLKRLDQQVLNGVDAQTAFLGVDSQDLPGGEVVLYIYAKKGTNLIQMRTPIGVCAPQPMPNEPEMPYYQNACLTKSLLANVRPAEKTLMNLFHFAE